MKIFSQTKRVTLNTLLMLVCFVFFLQFPVRCADDLPSAGECHKITATISSISASVEKALILREEGKNVLVIFDLCGTITHGREGDPVRVRESQTVVQDGEAAVARTGEFVPYKPEWHTHYRKCEPLAAYQGLLPQDLVNQHLRDGNIRAEIEKLHVASIPVIGATGRLPLSDEEVGCLSNTPDWLAKSAEAEKPTDVAATYKKKAMEKLKEEFSGETYEGKMVLFAANRSRRFEELSGVKFSQGAYHTTFPFQGGFYANGIAYMGFNKRTGILSLVDAFVQKNILADPRARHLDIVFVDDDSRTMEGFTKKSARDYLDKGITLHLMHYPWSSPDHHFDIHRSLCQEDQEEFVIIDIGDPGTDVDDLIDLIGWISHPVMRSATKLFVSTDEVEGGKRARFVKKIFGRQGIDVPVASGQWRGNAQSFLMDESDLTDAIEEPHYIDAMKEVMETAHGLGKKLIIKSHGPLTELSDYFTQFPGHKAYVDRIVQMGGALDLFTSGQKPKKEHNITCDVKAAQHIFKEFGEKIYLVTLDTTTATPACELHREGDIMALIQQSPYAEVVSKNLDRFLRLVEGKYSCSVMHDPLAASVVESMVLNRPSFVTFRQERLSIDDEGVMTRNPHGALIWVSRKESFEEAFREVWLKNPARYGVQDQGR